MSVPIDAWLFSEELAHPLARVARRELSSGSVEIIPPFVQAPDVGGPAASSGSGGANGGDLSSAIAGPYITGITPECVVGSGGKSQLVLHLTYGISHVTGQGITVVNEAYTPGSGT